MDHYQFVRVDGANEIYDVYCNGVSLGLAWPKAGIWYADRYSMLDPEACGATRDEAAAKLYKQRLSPHRIMSQ